MIQNGEWRRMVNKPLFPGGLLTFPGLGLAACGLVDLGGKGRGGERVY